MATTTVPKSRPQSTRRNPRMAIDEQRVKLFDAHAIIETTASALEAYFGGGWPSGVPDFRLALRAAARLVDEASGALELMCIEKRAAELAAPALSM